MSRLQITPAKHQRLSAQAQYLRGLLSAHDLTAREFARNSRRMAQNLGRPELTVSHQAVSGWLNGTRHPTLEHKEALAMILGVPLADLTLGCDLGPERSVPKSTLRWTPVFVPNSLQSHRYTLSVRADIDLTRPAIYPDWSSMFSFPPTRLKRHFRNIKYESYGWIPDTSASPMVHYQRCLVPIERVIQRQTLRELDSAESSRRRVWFVYLPDGELHVGIGYRHNSVFILARNEGTRLVIKEFPLRRIDLVGYFTGSVVFHFGLAAKKQTAQVIEDKTEGSHAA